MNITTTWGNRASFPPFCKEDEFLRHWIGRNLLYLLRGVAATLLMPIEVLEHLRRGRTPGWRTGLSWALSAAVYAGFYWLVKGALPGGHAALLLSALSIFFAVVFSGKFQADQDSGTYGFEATGRGWYHHRHHHGHHGWHRHHHDAFWRAVGSSGERATATVAPKTGRTGVCCGDCRKCEEEICVKTGVAKRRVTE